MPSSWRAVRVAAAVLALVTSAIVGIYLLEKVGPLPAFPATIGGTFQMTAHDGRVLTDADMRGKPFAIFFGFTQCPDVCPTTMLEVARMIELLGSDADKMRFLFVTVDPERDDSDLLRDYLSSFDKRIIGLRGTAEQTAQIVKGYRVYYTIVPTKDGYTINHTATMYLMDASGRLAKTIAYGEDERSRLKKLRDLIAESAASR